MSALRFRVTAVSLALLSLALVASPAFGALPPRTFVASYGLDTNPCSLTLPCRTFGAAVPAVTPGGEVIVLDSAGYGPTTITQSVSIIAPAGVYAGISVISPANLVGVTINAPGIKVVLQNLTINGLGGTYGIWLKQAAEVDVNNCTLSTFTGAGIYSTAANAKVNVRDTLVRDTSGTGPGDSAGIQLVGSIQAVLERVRVVGNPYGIIVQGAEVSVKRSILAGNGGPGIVVLATAGLFAAGTVEDSLIADNGGSGVSTGTLGVGAVAEFSAVRNTITRNGEWGVEVGTFTNDPATGSLSDNLISQQGWDGVSAGGGGAVATANNNTFAGNGTRAASAALNAAMGIIHTVKGANGLPNNAGEQTTPTIGNVFPSNSF